MKVMMMKNLNLYLYILHDVVLGRLWTLHSKNIVYIILYSAIIFTLNKQMRGEDVAHIYHQISERFCW